MKGPDNSQKFLDELRRDAALAVGGNPKLVQGVLYALVAQYLPTPELERLKRMQNENFRSFNRLVISTARKHPEAVTAALQAAKDIYDNLPNRPETTTP